MLKRRLRSAGAFAALAVPAMLLGQDQPLSVRGTFSTGYYSTSTTGQANQSLDFVPLGAKFEITGNYKGPGVLAFSVLPELNAGPQASDAGFQGGNGVQLRLTFLRNLAPLTFRYSNVQVEDVYFGSLSQLSGYSLKNRNKDLGLTFELKPANLPSATIDWGISSVNSISGTPGIPDYLSQSNHLNVDTKYERWNWVLDGFLHRQEQQSDLLEPIDGGTQFGTLQQTVLQYQGSARRSFLGDSELYLNAGDQSTSSLLFTLPIDLNTHYVNASLRMFQKRRWRTSLRAGYSSNLASQLLAQAASSLNGANSIAPGATALLPFSHGLSNFNLTGTTNVTLSHGLGLYASVERNAILSSNQDDALNANYFTASGGLTYAHKVPWGSVSGEYSREFGLGSITGQSGTIQGQTYRANVQHGSSNGLQIDGSVHGSDQSIHNVQPLSNSSLSVEGSVSDHLFGDFSGRMGGGWEWGSIVNSANEFRTNGYTARIGIEHPRFQISASLNDAISNSLPFYNQVLGGLGLGSVLFNSLTIIPSDYRAIGFTLHTNPIRKLELSAVYTRSRQHLDGILNNDFEFINVYVTYHFRRIQLEGGYILSNQIFAYYPNTMRERFYVRVVRSVKLL